MKQGFIVWLFLLASALGFSQGDGPKTMLMAPTNLNLFTPAYLNMSSNYNFAQDILIEGADITSDVIPVSFIRFMKIGNRFAEVWVTPVWGDVRGEVVNPEITQKIPTVQGFADPIVGMRIGLIGAPALTVEEFVKHEQGFQLYFYAGTTIPIGDYQQDRPVNLGTNRWAVRLAAPMVLPFGKGEHGAYFLEMTPSLMLYTKNDAPFGGTSRTQAPLAILETHLSKNLTKKFWVSLDTRSQQGGSTETDGHDDDNQISQISGGFTVGYQVIAPLGLQFSYGNILWSDSGKGQLLRVRITMLF